MATKKVLEYQVEDVNYLTFLYDKYKALRLLKTMGPTAVGTRCQIRLKDAKKGADKVLTEKRTTKFFG